MATLRSLTSRLHRAEAKEVARFHHWHRTALQAERDRWQQHTLLCLVTAGVLPAPDPQHPTAHFRDVMASQPLAYRAWYDTHWRQLRDCTVTHAEAHPAAAVVLRAWLSFQRTLPRP